MTSDDNKFADRVVGEVSRVNVVTKLSSPFGRPGSRQPRCAAYRPGYRRSTDSGASCGHVRDTAELLGITDKDQGVEVP